MIRLLFYGMTPTQHTSIQHHVVLESQLQLRQIEQVLRLMCVCTLIGLCVEQQGKPPLWPEGVQLWEEVSAVLVDS